MDTSPQDIFILDWQLGQEKPFRQQKNTDDSDDVEEADSSEENSENNDDDSVSALKGVGSKERGVNGVKNRGHVSSDESSDDDDDDDDDDDVDISTVASAKDAVATSIF